MREILFRGQAKNDTYRKDGDWIYSSFIMQDPKTELLSHQVELFDGSRWVAIDPETVGQYTGLTANGTKIFEGDIVKATFSYNNWMQDRVEKRTATYEVRYNEKYCYFYLAKHQNNMLFDGNWTYFLSEIEVIGNIHDNPELLEGGVK